MTASQHDGRALPDLARVVLRPVRGHHAFEACVEQLATAIRLGVHPNGSTLPPERELADRMHVSRATVREAITALRTAGMVETRRGRGGGSTVTYSPRAPRARSTTPSPEQLESWHDALTFRRIVEPGAVATAAALDLTEGQRDMLSSAHEAVMSASGSASHRQADSRFHLAFASVTGSPLIIDAVTRAQATLHEMLLQIPVYDVNISHSDRQHERILRAVLDGRPERARQTMEEHCDDTAALLRGLLG
ncbi:MAG TPA: FCD domain-containing protein [Nocardioides sp.]|nr:FCD domain-containing protein [Nocardioides sp.]